MKSVPKDLKTNPGSHPLEGKIMKRKFSGAFGSIFLGVFSLILCIPAAAQSDLAGDWDVVVIGGGLMGSSTAWQLANRGQRVLLLEKQGEVYTQGSSFGDARISRSLGPPGDIWSYMHNRTVAEAHELIAFLKDNGESASMNDIYTTSPVNYVRHIDRVAGYDYLPDQPDQYDIAITPDQARNLFGIKMPEDAFIVREYKEHSGTINPAAIISLLHQGTTLAGGRVAYNQEVTRLSRAGERYEIVVADGTTGKTESLSVGKVVSAAGPYTGGVLKEVAPDFDRLITPKRIFLAFFEVTPQFWNGLSSIEQKRLKDLFPGINSTVPGRGAGTFSMIERYTAQGTPIIKIGGHFQRTDIQDLDSVWEESLSDDEVAWAREGLLQHLSLMGIGLTDKHLRLESGYSCVYSLTASEVPYVSNAPMRNGDADPNLVVVGGLSGVGAKGSMGYGVLATDLLLGHSETDPNYLAARDAFGFDRMQRDVTELGR
jgi:glycine/D-amino acid oxidase-like deaminating enzyme